MKSTAKLKSTLAKPTSALLICSMPCERKAASILAKTNDAILSNDEGMIIYRYFQSYEGQENTQSEMACITLIFLLFLLNAYAYRESNHYLAIAKFFLALPPIAFLPSFFNYRTYTNAMTRCEAWLSTNLSSTKWQETQELALTRNKM